MIKRLTMINYAFSSGRSLSISRHHKLAIPHIHAPNCSHLGFATRISAHTIASHRSAATVTASSSPSPTTNGSTTQTDPNGWLHPSQPIAEDYDAIMVLGGGVWENGVLPPWVVRRLEGGLHIYNKQKAVASSANSSSSTNNSIIDSGHNKKRAPPIVLLGAGTPHKPAVLTPSGHVLHESSAYVTYLMQRGVACRDLLKESQSYDTVGNAYFSLVIHALPAHWRKLAIITSDFHMPRTKAVFDTTYNLAPPLHSSSSTNDENVKVNTSLAEKSRFILSYHPVSDEGLFDNNVIEARKHKEAAAISRWHQDTGHFTNLAELHSWLFDTHLCYAACRQHEFGVKDDLDPKLAATY